MTIAKVRLALLFGGQSCEHEVSVMSAQSVAKAVDSNRYALLFIGVSKQGRWRLLDDPQQVFAHSRVREEDGISIWVDHNQGGGFMLKPGADSQIPVDVVLPVLHGTHGEDGSIQGLLELAGIAYVGSGISGSAVGMDKSLTKQVLQAENIPQLPYRVYAARQWQAQTAACLQQLTDALPWPVFVKPCSQGSSVGVSRADNTQQLLAAVDLACRYDRRFIIEQAATGCREIECAVLGNDPVRVSLPGEIRPRQGFYDYRAKYQDDSAELLVPAPLHSAQVARVQQLTVQVFDAIGAADLARVDFFVDTKNDLFYVNEINTLPGFTPISMYPRLWWESGISYPELIDTLVELALQRQRQASELQQVLRGAGDGDEAAT